jgi:hypothetical protein
LKPETQIRRFKGRRGQAAILAVLNLTMLFGALGFAVDIGLAQFKKHAEQATADAAAMAAASYAAANGSTCGSGITCNVVTNCTIPNSVTTPFGAGCVYAKANGYTNGGSGGQTVTMIANNTNSPVTGNSPSLWFQATVGESYSTLFGSFAASTALTIHASAVAGVTTTGGGSCIIALSQGPMTSILIRLPGWGNLFAGIPGLLFVAHVATPAFSDSGSGNITTSAGCGIYDNSNFSYTGSGNITAGTTIQYIGTKTMNGSGNVSPAPTSTVTPINDPFASLPSPTVGSCTNPNVGLPYPLVISDANNHTIAPGTYCGGMKFSGSGNITFQTGTYIINGSDAGGKSFDFSASGNLSGTNVMFFITGQGGETAGPISFTGSGNLTFSALNAGSYEGVLFYQDRNVTYAAANTYSGSGNVTGTLYFPTTSLSYSGSGNALAQALVANTVTMTGSGNFTKDNGGTLTGLVKTVAALIQ